jgi:hypothetical protein
VPTSDPATGQKDFPAQWINYYFVIGSILHSPVRCQEGSQSQIGDGSFPTHGGPFGGNGW